MFYIKKIIFCLCLIALTTHTSSAQSPDVATIVPTITFLLGDEASCETAAILEEGTSSVDSPIFTADGVIQPKGNIDFYKFSATAGDWWSVSASNTDMNSPLDTALSLFDIQGDVLIAQNNNGIPLIGTGSEVLVKISESGEYCIQVEDASTFTQSAHKEGQILTMV